jgi:hypothetical protein
METLAQIPSGALALRAELQGDKAKKIGSWSMAENCVELRLGADSMWAILRFKDDTGFALRCAWAPGAALELRSKDASAIHLLSSLGTYKVEVTSPDPSILQVVTTLVPSADVLVPWWPRDLYPLGPDDDPEKSVGNILAAQRGMNTALLYGQLKEPTAATFLYLQDLTALNDYFNQTGTKPDGVVGGQWPEMGYCAPPAVESPLKKGQEIVVSRAFLRVGAAVQDGSAAEARLFVDHLGAIYPFLLKPEPEYRDWPSKAEATVQALRECPLVTTKDGEYTYLRPYVDAESPDSMVQIAVCRMLKEYADWGGSGGDLVELFGAGIYRFFDPAMGVVRRYLSTIGPNKDADVVDSWYMYHPLQNLARLAKKGVDGALKVFVDSLDYAIEVAHCFNYAWPIQFSQTSLMIKTASRKPGEAVGQTDAGGLYAYVMLDAYELIGEQRFLDEAKCAIEATRGLEFNLTYQTNLTSWGAAACFRLWKLTKEQFFLDQMSVFLASFFHNCTIWDSAIGKVSETTTFFGVTCLHDGPYLAPFECYESFMAFRECMSDDDCDIPESSRLLMSEFCRYGLDRAWWFYPAELEPTSLAHDPRNGKILRSIAIPVEDLYVNGDPAGQVGQEVYGCGAALAYTTLSYHRLATDRLFFCDQAVSISDVTKTSAKVRVRGPEGVECQARLLPPNGWKVKVNGRAKKETEIRLKAGTTLELSWEKSG